MNFSRRHPAGNQFVEYFGETLFRSAADLCNADVAMGDLLIHEGAPALVQATCGESLLTPIRPYFVPTDLLPNKVVPTRC